MSLRLPKEDVMELWRVKVTNLSSRKRKLSIYPYYTVGYMSWMNQSGSYVEDLQGIVCSAITPYQKYQDYSKIKNYSDKTPDFDLVPCMWNAAGSARYNDAFQSREIGEQFVNGSIAGTYPNSFDQNTVCGKRVILMVCMGMKIW